MGADPVRSLVSSDNALLYVGNLHSQEVTVYSIEDGRRIDHIHVGDGPSALAFSSAGHLLFVVDRQMFTMLPAGRGPNAIAVKTFKAS